MFPSEVTPQSTEAPKPADLGRLHRLFRAWETNKQAEQREAREARQYYHDMQWSESEKRTLERRGQQATVRNRIKRKVDFLVGIEQRLRRDPKAYPRTPKHEQDADTATAGLRFACETNRWEKVSSDCMHDGLVSGIGAVFVGIEGGDPVLRLIPVDRFFYDPRATMPDFSDARYMGIHMWMDVDDATAQWPAHAEQLKGMVDATNVQMTGMITEQDRGTQWGDFENRRVRVVEFYDKRPLAPMMTGFGWFYTYFTGQLELDAQWSPYKGEKNEPDCPYEAWCPYIDHQGVRYGMVRTMKSVQDEINYSASKILYRIAADRFFYDEGSVEDVDELGRQLARPDGKIKIRGGEWGKTVGIIDQGQKLQGEVERFQMAVTEIENIGPNPGLVGQGQGVDGASGRALLAQRDSGMTELSPIFERHRDWKLRVYRKLWQRCRQVWTAEKWIRITDDERSVQFVPLNHYSMAPDGTLVAQNIVAELDVDIMLNEGPDTITMNEELMQTLASIGEAATGPLGKVMIELSNAPNKERLLKMIDSANALSPEVAAMQARMAKMEEMMAAAQIDEKIAGVENKRADTFQKLVTASTPQQQETDEFGTPVGAPPSAPDFNMAMAAMSMFPLQYGMPTLEQLTMMNGGVEQQAPQQGQAMMPPGMPAPGVVPPQLNEPEQLADAGALPINPEA